MCRTDEPVSWLSWIAFAGGLLSLFAVASAYVQRLPISTSAIYLALGVALGPSGFDVLHLDLTHHAVYVERVTELALVIALFSGGLRLRLRWRDPVWRPAFLLAGPVMVLSIIAVAAVAHLALGLRMDAALLLAALLAPTDPVLASAVAVKDAADHDRMRYALSGEAGLNDGTAFPFVVLALTWTAHDGAGPWLIAWAIAKVLWAVPAALIVGYALGLVIGRLAIHLRSRARDTSAPNDFLALALIALAYVIAELIGAWASSPCSPPASACAPPSSASSSPRPTPTSTPTRRSTTPTIHPPSSSSRRSRSPRRSPSLPSPLASSSRRSCRSATPWSASSRSA